ncbi:MAG TPA: hypothetical protein VGO47_12920 [Chlamydiales bacterium]|jgi:hypothetical protein|nr:hypothetical protein [Chlamydiales bacterium]
MFTSIGHAVVFASQGRDHEAVQVYLPPHGHVVATHCTKVPLGSPANLFEGSGNSEHLPILIQSHGRKTTLIDVMSGHAVAHIQHEVDGAVYSLSVRKIFAPSGNCLPCLGNIYRNFTESFGRGCP